MQNKLKGKYLYSEIKKYMNLTKSDFNRIVNGINKMYKFWYKYILDDIYYNILEFKAVLNYMSVCEFLKDKLPEKIKEMDKKAKKFWVINKYYVDLFLKEYCNNPEVYEIFINEKIPDGHWWWKEGIPKRKYISELFETKEEMEKIINKLKEKGLKKD